MYAPVRFFNPAPWWRLFRLGWTLSRHDALFLADREGVPALIRLPMRWGTWIVRRRGLPARPGERLALALTVLGPTFVKFGQALSVRPDLVGGDLARDLGSLRDRLPPFPAAAARATIEAELGQPLTALFAAFDDVSVAAASIAQVHFATTSDGRDVAVKVLRPGVEAAFRRDLALFAWIAGWAEQVAELRRLRPMAVVQTLRDAVTMELDLRLEASAAAELKENFAGDPELHVPGIDWPRTARRVLTMERIGGVPVGNVAALEGAGIDRTKVAAAVITTFLKQAMRDGFFHADLHHGNLFVAADGTLQAVDFGIMGRLDLPTRRFMAEMLHAFVVGDWRKVAEVHFAAGYVPATKSLEAFAQAARSIGEPIRGKPVEEISLGRLLAQLFEITETFDMPTQPQLLLLQKTMVTAEGVARTLDPAINFWEVARPVLEEWLAANLGPAARLEDAIVDGVRLLRRLPDTLAAMQSAATRLATTGVRLDDDTVQRLAAEQARRRGGQSLALWLLVALLFFALVLA